MRYVSETEKRQGTECTFWKNVTGPMKGNDHPWVWTGYINNNHNTTNGKSYDYGEFKLTDRSGRSILKTKMAHRVSVYLTFGYEVPSQYDVFPLHDDNHLDVNPYRLGVRHKKTGREMPASVFAAANDNTPSSEIKVAA